MLEHNYLFNRISITSIDNNKLVGFVISITPGLSQFVNVHIAIYVYQLDILNNYSRHCYFHQCYLGLNFIRLKSILKKLVATWFFTQSEIPIMSFDL